MLKYLRFSSFGDSKLFEEFVSRYDALIVNAHISSYYNKSLSSFLYENSAKYVIDPRSFIFQMSPTEVFDKKTKKRISTSYRKLFNSHYSEMVIDKFLGTSSGLSIEDLEGCYADLYQGAISSQINAFYGTDFERLLSPSVLITPSFALLKEYSDADIGRVLSLNIKSINSCNDTYAKIFDVGALLILDKEVLLRKESLQSIIDYYSSAQVRYIYLWIDGFNCFKSDIDTLKSYRKLINGLMGHNIIDLYADYSSFMLCSDNSPTPMYGVCITAGYNESRTIRGVMGMSPAAKYYMQDIHTRFPPADFMRILAARDFFDDDVSEAKRAERFFQEICDCPVCRDAIGLNINNIRKFTQVITTKGGRQQSANSSLVLAQRHFLYAKLQEVIYIESNEYKVLSRQLEDALLDYADFGFTGLQGIGYWLNVFK